MKFLPIPLAVAVSLALNGPLYAADDASQEGADSESALELNRIVVVTEGQEETATDSSVSVIDSEQIERNLSTDLESLLRYEPGVGVTKDSRFGIEGISIRGLDENRVRITVDGVEQADAYGPTTTYLRTGRSTLDLDSIEAVEITKGGDVTEGSGGLAGGVKFRTKEPSSFLQPEGDDSHVSLKTGYRSASDEFSNTLTLANRSGDLESLLVYTHRKSQETDTYEGSDELGDERGEADPGDVSSDNILAKLQYQLNDANRIGLVAEHFASDSNFDLLSESTSASLHSSDDESERDRIGIFHEYRQDTALFDSLRWQLDYQKTKTENGTWIESTTSERYVDRFYEEKSAQASVDLIKQLGDHALRYGISYTDESLENLNKNTVDGSTEVTRFSPKADGASIGAYLEDSWALSDRLTLIPALRYDHYQYTTTGDQYIDDWGDNSGHALTAQLGSEYQLTPSWSLFGKYGTGFRAPAMDDLYYYYENSVSFGGNTWGYLIAPNPDLKPERSIFLEGGVRTQNGFASAEVTLFYNRYRDFIEQVSLGTTSTYTLGVYTNENIDKVTIKGVEFKGNLDLHGMDERIAEGWTLTTAAAYADGWNEEDDEPLDSISPLTVVAGLSYDHPHRRWGGSLNLTWVDGKDEDDLSEDSEWLSIPSHTLLDLTGYYNLSKNLKVSAGLFNLTDEKYWVWNDIRELSSVSTNLDRYTQPGRNLGIDLTLAF